MKVRLKQGRYSGRPPGHPVAFTVLGGNEVEVSDEAADYLLSLGAPWQFEAVAGAKPEAEIEGEVEVNDAPKPRRGRRRG